MKGTIIYSSLTGNTKKAAERLADLLADLADWQLADLRETPDVSESDLVLVGAWVDRGLPEKKTLAYLETLDKTKPLGLFGTLGAMPESYHGRRVQEGLAGLLEGRPSLGYGLLPGLVDPKVLERVRHMPDHVLDPEVRRQMIEAGETSRWASEDEYRALADHFRQGIQQWQEKGAITP